jgi:pimeloyl-ACP methyl ester carboxylesterase
LAGQNGITYDGAVIATAPNPRPKIMSPTDRTIAVPRRGRAVTGRVAAVRLARHVVRLDDGHPVGIAVAHGFTAQGILYAQTLSRLVGMGFKVVAVDVPGHGRTPRPRHSPLNLDAYTSIVSRVIRHLGIRQAVLVGHSFGGRLMAEVADQAPEDVVALVLVDAIVGQPWDEMVGRIRWCPGAGANVLVRLVLDTVTTVPLLDDPGQAIKLLSLIAGASMGIRPFRLAAPALALLVSAPSAPALDRLGRAGVPAIVVHGAGDLPVSLAVGRDAAARLGADLAVVEGARHSWLLRDPETLPAILGRLLASRLGDAWNAALSRAGLDASSATIADIEGALYEPGAPILALTPPLTFTRSAQRRRPARYRWTIEPASTT